MVYVRLCNAAGNVELLAARSLALLRSLTEYEEATFLDQTMSHAETKTLARDVAARATLIAGKLSLVSVISWHRCYAHLGTSSSTFLPFSYACRTLAFCKLAAQLRCYLCDSVAYQHSACTGMLIDAEPRQRERSVENLRSYL